jgi:PAS domain S-box-containing protein
MPKKKAAAAKNGARATTASRGAARTLAFAREVFEAVPIGLVAYDHTGQCVAANEAAAAAGGATVEQLLAQNFRQLESWKRTGLLAAAEKTLATGRGRRLEASVTTTFGRDAWLEFCLEAFGRNGDRHLLIAVTDRTADRQALAASVRSYGDRQFEQIFDLSVVGKSLTAADGRLLRVNRALADMLGYTREELQATNFAVLTHPDDVAASRELIRCLMAGERETCSLEKRYRHKNGSIVWASVHSALLRDDRGNPQCLVTNIVDITDRKRAEAELRENAATLLQTFDDAPVGEVMVGLDKRFLHANKSFCAFLGYREEELIGKTIADVTHPEDKDLGMADLRAIASGEKKTAHTRKRYVRKDGTAVWGDVTMALVRDTQGRPAYFLPTIQDITERVRTEEAVARYSRELTVRNRIAQILLTTPGDDMYFEALQVVLDVMQSPYGVFGYIDEQGALVVPTMTRHVWDKCDIPDKTITFPRSTWGDSSWPTAIREKRVIVANEPSTEIPPGHVPILRHVSFPIRFQDEVIGLLQVANKDSDYTKADVDLLATMADTIAPVLDARLTRARREEALRDSWERLEEAQAVALVGNWEWDAVADVITGSSEFHRLFDVPAAQLARFGQFLERLHPDDRKRVEGDVADALRKDRPYDTDYRVRLRDGGWRDLNARGRAFVDRDGKPLRMVGTCQDVTERKAMEAALRDANDNLEHHVRERTEELQAATSYNRGLIEASIDPLVTIGPDGRITDVNRTTEEATGRTRRELIGTDFSDYFTDPAKARDGYRQVFADGLVRDYELQLRHADGHTTPVHYNATVYRDDAGRVVGVFAAARDVTESKRVAENLARTRQLLDETGRLARVGGWELDLRIDKLSWTDAVYLIHELGPEFEPTLESATRFYAPEAVPLISAAVKCAIADGTPFDLELPLITARQRRIWVRAVGQAYREDGTTVKVGGVFQDITARKLAEDELRLHRDRLEELVATRTRELEAAVTNLERSNKELEQFAYVASHDLQEPLRMISSYTQLLAQRYGDQLDDQAKKFIGYAVDGAVRMQRQINDLLTYSRVGTRGKPLEPTDAHAVLGEAIRNLMAAIEEQHALVVTDDLPTVRADAGQLVVVFQNLLANAIKFHGADAPRVRVSARDGGKEWVFSVQDNGIGIEPQYADRLFVIFQRLHTREEYPGSGIGLAICRRIVERHGGRIWFESEPGKGATFFFTVPKQER